VGLIQLYAVYNGAAVDVDFIADAHFSSPRPSPRTTTGRTPADASTRPTHLLFMDRLIDAVAAYLCRHRSVGLLRLTLDLTRRRLFAEIGAVEVVKGAIAPPTPDTETWWIAVRETVYALRERGLVQYVWEAEVASWTGPPRRQTDSAKPNCEEWRSFSPFFSFFFSRRAEEWRLAFTQFRMK
jgi:hypothetical protein